MPGLLTYWRTVRYLKPVQVFGRLRYHFARPKPALQAAPKRRTRNGTWVRPPARAALMTGPATFEFLGESRDVSSRTWDEPHVDKLWRYNLHYFDDLNAAGANERASWHRDLLSRWVAENPPAHGTAWDAYPTSLRLVNWVKWTLAGGDLPDVCIQSAAVQARWLSRRLERHILGNHLFANAKALVFAGLFFDGPEADEWFETGCRILTSEIPEQILGDGAHFELSTMYHALALEDVLDLCNVLAAYRPHARAATALDGALRARVAAMRGWLDAMSHPDGDIAFFNDAAFGTSLSAAALDRYAIELGFPALQGTPGNLTHGESGYVRCANRDAVVLIDAAAIGPDYLPAHAHADSLSFELSLFGQRVLVNSGTSHYRIDAERMRQRGTAAHNTVVVDGENSSEVWASFRMARRARPIGRRVIADAAAPQVECAHDGYRRLAGDVVHTRRWTLEERVLRIDDMLTGRFSRAEARFHLHPHVLVEPAAPGDTGQSLTFSTGTRRVRLSVRGGALSTVDATWHPRFGESQPARCIVARFDGPTLATTITWDDIE